MTTRTELLRLAMEEFAFLGETDGCELEVIEPHTLLTTVAYKFATVAVELRFDWRDLDVACYFSMLSEGRLPEGYLLQDGKRSARMIDYIRIYAGILRSSFPDLRSKAEAGFFPDEDCVA